jgi:hypothetical protein
MDYLKVYQRFISDRQSKEPAEFAGRSYIGRQQCAKPKDGREYHHHHITPREFGGGDESKNIISLSPEDHIHAHILLAAFLGGRQWMAVNMMVNTAASRKKQIPGKLLRKAAAFAASRMYGDSHPDTDKTIHEFHHVDGDVFVGTRFEFSTQKAIPKASINNLFSKNGSRSACGWFLPKRNSAETVGMPKRERNNKFNPELYLWENFDTKEKKHATLYDMHAEFGGSRASWTSVLSGDKTSIFGWHIEGKPPKRRTSKGKHFHFVNRSGVEFLGTQTEFARHAGISSTGCTRVAKYKSVTACGWRLYGTEDRHHNAPKNGGRPGTKAAIITLVKGAETLVGDRVYLAEKLGTTPASVSATIYQIKKGKCKTFKGWTLTI